jgi:uncharacterized protein (TIGR02646 family)
VIRVDRSRESAPAILGKLTQGKSETDRAIEHYTNGWDGKSTFPFSRYKEDEVKAALERLFHGKCAYCESRFAHVSPEDIEHWRPKGAVQLADGSEAKPGYYWLAASWSNLLPSCIDCNRRRRQIDVRDSSHLQSGKQGQFPVVDETKRWTRHDYLNGEQPLLLDPTSQEPEDEPGLYLEVVDKDGKAVVGEKPPPGTFANDRARATIEVFGLNRARLEEERREHRLRLQTYLQEARRAAGRLAKLPADAMWDEIRAETREILGEKLAQIKHERQPKSPYLLMKIPLIDSFMAEIGPVLRQLGLI